jgi:hypothetical protein
VIVDDLANDNVRKVLGCIRLIDWYEMSILRESFNNNKDTIIASIANKVLGSW